MVGETAGNTGTDGLNPWRARCGENRSAGSEGGPERRIGGNADTALRSDPYTYLTCGEGDMFLCAVRDGNSRRVLGHAIDDHFGADLVIRAVDRAVATRGGRCEGTVLHSDRGGEFTASATENACSAYGLRRSMGDTGICWDNSPAEAFWSTFKHECYYRHVFATRAELAAAVDKWIDWYNNTRRHSAIGMLSPVRYEQSLTEAAEAA